MAKVKIKLLDYIGSGGGFFDEEGCTGQSVVDALDSFPEADEVDVSIGSNGGDVDQGLVIYNALLGSGKTVNVTILSNARSISAIIAMAASPGRLKAYKNSRLMIHPAWTMAMGNAEALRKTANELDSISNELFQIILDRRGDKLKISEEALRGYFDEEKDITASQALEFGLIDEVISASQVIDLTERTYQSRQAYAFYTPKTAEAPAPTPLPAMKNKQSGLLARITQAFATALSGGILNASVALKEGGLVYYEGDLGEGTMLYSDEAMTTAVADAEHTLEDGRKVTTSGGSVTTVSEAVAEEAPAADVQALQNQVAELQNQLNAANAAKEAAVQAQVLAVTEKETAIANLKTLNTQFSAFKAEWQGDADEKLEVKTVKEVAVSARDRAAAMFNAAKELKSVR